MASAHLAAGPATDWWDRLVVHQDDGLLEPLGRRWGYRKPPPTCPTRPTCWSTRPFACLSNALVPLSQTSPSAERPERCSSTSADAQLIPVPDLEAGLAFYQDALGHQLIWRTDTAAGLRLGDAARSWSCKPSARS
jgi:hypothetical protein